MSHYTHHIDDSGKEEPTIIEIKGEPYPEELDLELHRGNALAHEGMGCVARLFQVLDMPSTKRDIQEALDALQDVYAKYEKMVSGE